MVNRCKWVNLNNDIYIRYHDEEWGMRLFDDRKLLELLILESFQAGLSWECILNKRDAFRKAFDFFDLEKICNYDDTKIKELSNNKDIIRNKLKIKAAINNAMIFRKIRQEFGSFSNYIWGFTKGCVVYETGNVSSDLSDIISNDLRIRGMKFVGTIIIYSYLQAIGVIYSHDIGCFKYKEK